LKSGYSDFTVVSEYNGWVAGQTAVLQASLLKPL